MRITHLFALIVSVVCISLASSAHALYIPPAGACWGDGDRDGDVDGVELAWVARDFGKTDCDEGQCPGDLNRDGKVDMEDLDKVTGELGQSDCKPPEEWDDPCADPVSGYVYHVSNLQEFYDAVENAWPGDHIVMATGNYYLENHDWDSQTNRYGLYVDKDLTISGAGSSRTIIHAEPYIVVDKADQVVFRNLAIVDGTIGIRNVHRFAICNVLMRYPKNYYLTPYFLHFRPKDNENHLVRVLDSSIACSSGPCSNGAGGIWIANNFWATLGILPRFDVMVKNSNISVGNTWGIFYVTSYRIFPGSPKEEILHYDVALDVDCEDFVDNTYDVCEQYFDEGRKYREKCP